jgi:hypothetical protein
MSALRVNSGTAIHVRHAFQTVHLDIATRPGKLANGRIFPTPESSQGQCRDRLQADFSPRISLTLDHDHASRAKGGWSDPARVVHNSPRAGPLMLIRADIVGPSAD